MGILQKTAVRTSNSFDVLSNLKDAPDYHHSKMKRKQARGPKKLHDTDMNLNYTIPVIVNGQVFSSKSEKMSAISDKETDNGESPVSWFSSKSSHMKDHKVLIVGDSDARNYAANVKTETGTDILVNSANSDIISLSKSDVLIFCGGANNVRESNCTKTLHHIVDFIKASNHTNIILVTVPPTYDLMQSSCVNSEVKSFNRKLKKIGKVYQHTSVLEMDNDWKLFTNHGLHLNGQGKEMLSKLIVCHTYSVLEQRIDPPIILNWKSDQKLTFTLNQVDVINGTSTRPRKTPSTKSEDFYCKQGP